MNSPTREQQEKKLDSKDWQHLTESATQAAHSAAQSPNTILSVRSSESADSSLSQSGPSRKGSSQQGSSSNAEGDGGNSGFGGFVSGFKAMISSMLPKPDPLVCALCEAAAHGDVRLVEGLIEQGADIEGKNENRDTPMHVAVQANQAAVVMALIEAGADPTAASGSPKLPPLFQAAAAGHIDLAAALIESGHVDPQQTDQNDVASYFYAVVKTGSVDGIKLLLANGAEANGSQHGGSRPVMAAIKRESAPLVRLLISHGASVKGSDNSGTSIMEAAVKTGSLDIVRPVLEAGGDVDTCCNSGLRVLTYSVVERNVPLALLLLNHGADGNRSTLSGQPLLITVIRDRQLHVRDKTELVRRLLQRGAKAKCTENGQPALRYALEQQGGLPEIVGLLLQHGADASGCRMGSGNTGETALAYAVRMGKADEVAMLLKYGVNANDQFKANSGAVVAAPPLVQAVARGDAGMVRLLREHGARLDETMLAFAKSVVQNAEIYDVVTAAPAGGESAAVETETAPATASSGRRQFEISMSVNFGRGNVPIGGGTRAASPPPAYEATASPVSR